VNFARGEIPSGSKSPQKCIRNVTAQETAKHHAKFGWPPVNDVAGRCSSEAKTRNPLKFARVRQTPEPISAVSGPKFAILWGHVEKILLFTNFFTIVDTCLSCEDTAQQSCAMVPRWRFFASFLRPVFPASRVQHISHLHSTFALRPHDVWKYGRHPICDR